MLQGGKGDSPEDIERVRAERAAYLHGRAELIRSQRNAQGDPVAGERIAENARQIADLKARLDGYDQALRIIGSGAGETPAARPHLRIVPDIESA